MKRIESEDAFQTWVLRQLSSIGHAHDHRMSAQPHVPDLSASCRGQDLWLELKFERVRLGHDKYDDFGYTEEKAGQLAWLEQRARFGRSTCGLLGYLHTGGVIDYLCFTTVEAYRGWKGTNVGAVLLSDMSCAFRPEMGGDQLLRFVLGAARRCLSRPCP